VIPLVGAALTGLDEWMQRVGQLQVICGAAAEVEGTQRIARVAAEILCHPVALEPTEFGRFATFARLKRLAQVSKGDPVGTAPSRSKFRYPHLVVRSDLNGDHLEVVVHPPEVWAQDYWMSQPGVRSRTGGVTVSGRVGSKTGIDHLLQWAQKAGLLTRVGQLSPTGRLLSTWAKPEGQQENPYWGSPAILVAGFCLVRADLDVFSRLIPRLQTLEAPFGKKEGASIFGETVIDIAAEADADRAMSSGRRRTVHELLRDLKRAARRSRSRDALGATATAWHRAVSRLETYVDLGLLTKVHGRSDHSFKYKYSPTPALERTASSLQVGSEATTWVEHDFFYCLFDLTRPKWEPGHADLLAIIPLIARHLKRGRAPLPIEAVGLAMVVAADAAGSNLSLSEGRELIRALAETHPGRVSLMRGERGERAEFVSLVEA